jgi:chitinase
VTPDQDPGYLTFAAHADELDAVHPMWWHVTGAATFAPIYGEGNALILGNTTYAGKRTLLIPTIAAADGSDPQTVSQMLYDANLRAQHVAAIRALVASHHYDGIDLDYEHLPDGDRDAFSQLARELAQGLHADGKTLSYAVQGETRASTFWDYTALSQVVDQLHVMAYDFHSLGTHPGPVSPLGWVEDIGKYINTVGNQQKFILGLPNYGTAGPDSGVCGWFGSSMDCINQAGGNYAVTTDHMNNCSYTNGIPMLAGRAPNAFTSQGHLFFDDLASHEEKVTAAQNAGLGGITYWTIGGEPDRPGPRTFFQMIRSYFPQ